VPGAPGPTIADCGEFGLIARIRKLVEPAGEELPPDLPVGIGDDAAVLRPEPGWDLVVTCDAQVAGRHFLPGAMSARAIGRRAMTVNLSDIAAMGAEPRHAFLSLGLPAGMTIAFVEDLYRGFLDALAESGGRIAGGNLTGTGPEWFIDVTLIGRVERGRAQLRSGARPGDRIFCTGSPGRSAAGLAVLRAAAGAADPPAYDEEEWAIALVDAYVRPHARVAAGRFLAGCAGVTAMADISDGVVGDLTRICESSSVPARLDASRLPLDPDLEAAAAVFGVSRADWSLGPGDDYELLFTVRPEDAEAVAAGLRAATGLQVTEIGEMTFGRAHPLVEIVGRAAGRGGPAEGGAGGEAGREPRRKADGEAEPGGWDHFRK